MYAISVAYMMNSRSGQTDGLLVSSIGDLGVLSQRRGSEPLHDSIWVPPVVAGQIPEVTV